MYIATYQRQQLLRLLRPTAELQFVGGKDAATVAAVVVVRCGGARRQSCGWRKVRTTDCRRHRTRRNRLDWEATSLKPRRKICLMSISILVTSYTYVLLYRFFPIYVRKKGRKGCCIFLCGWVMYLTYNMYILKCTRVRKSHQVLSPSVFLLFPSPSLSLPLNVTLFVCIFDDEGVWGGDRGGSRDGDNGGEPFSREWDAVRAREEEVAQPDRAERWRCRRESWLASDKEKPFFHLPLLSREREERCAFPPPSFLRSRSSLVPLAVGRRPPYIEMGPIRPSLHPGLQSDRPHPPQSFPGAATFRDLGETKKERI